MAAGIIYCFQAVDIHDYHREFRLPGAHPLLHLPLRFLVGGLVLYPGEGVPISPVSYTHLLVLVCIVRPRPHLRQKAFLAGWKPEKHTVDQGDRFSPGNTALRGKGPILQSPNPAK